MSGTLALKLAQKILDFCLVSLKLILGVRKLLLQVRILLLGWGVLDGPKTARWKTRTNVSEKLALLEFSFQQSLYLSPRFRRLLGAFRDQLRCRLLGLRRLLLCLADILDGGIAHAPGTHVKVLLLRDCLVQLFAVRTHLRLQLPLSGFVLLELLLRHLDLVGKLLFLGSQIGDLVLEASDNFGLAVALEGVVFDGLLLLLQYLLELSHPGGGILAATGVILQIMIPSGAKVLQVGHLVAMEREGNSG